MRPALPCVLTAALLLAGCARTSNSVSAVPTTESAPTAETTIQDGTSCTILFLPQDAAAAEGVAEPPAPTGDAGGGAPAASDPGYQERITELFTAAENGEISRVLKALEKGLN